MKLILLSNGSLSLQSESEDIAELLQIKENCGDDDIGALCDLLEWQQWEGNGLLYRVAPDEIGALTDAPILTDEVAYLDSAEEDYTERSITGSVWWFPEYESKNWLDVLINHGFVVFTKGV